MQIMRFDPNLYSHEMLDVLEKFVWITGVEPWVRKSKVLKLQKEENPLLEDWQLEHHGAELKLFQLLAQRRKNGVLPLDANPEELSLKLFELLEQRSKNGVIPLGANPEDWGYGELISLVGGTARIYDQLTPAGQRRLRGMLLDGLKPDDNLLSLQHELTIAAHLVRVGCDVDFNDMERGGIDFIATRRGLEFEVECKMFTSDLGRKVPRRKLIATHHHLEKAINGMANRLKGGYVITVKIPGRLTASLNQLAVMEGAVEATLLSGQGTLSPECDVKLTAFALVNTPFSGSNPNNVSSDEINQFARGMLRHNSEELLVAYSGGQYAVLLAVESAQPNQIGRGIDRQLREGAKRQFSGKRPGVLCVQFRELTADQFEEIGNRRTPSTMDDAPRTSSMSSLFSESRSHIHSVVYRARSRLRHRQIPIGIEIGNADKVYFVENRDHPYFGDDRLRLF